MQKNFTKLIAHFLSAKRYTVPAGAFLLFLATSLYVLAAVGVTVSGDASFPISADLAANSDSPTKGFTTLGGIVILEEADGDFSKGGNLILTAPTGWIFKQSGVTAAVVNGLPTGNSGTNVSVDNTKIGYTATTITIAFAVDKTNQRDKLTISGVEVQSLNGSNLPGTGNIAFSLTNGAVVVGLPATLNKALSQVAGAARKLNFTTQPGGALTNEALNPQPVVAIQDQFGNIVTTASNTVSLNIVGAPAGVLLTNASKAATNGDVSFSNVAVNLAGTYRLAATSGNLTAAQSVESGFVVNNKQPTITAVSGCLSAGDPETTVTITGENFVSGASVTFGGVSASSVTVNNATTITAVLPATAFSTSGTKNVIVTNPLPASSNGVSAPFAKSVTALFSFPIEGPNSICASTANSTAFTVQTGANVSSYVWSVVSGDATISSGGATGNPRITFGSTAGQVVLSVIFNNVCGKPGPAVTKTITVNARPDVVLNASSTAICAGESVELSASGAESYVWSGTGVAAGTIGSSIDVTPTANTTYTVVGSNSYTVDGTTTSCPTTKTITITVTPALTQGAITGATQLCQNQTVAAASALTATASGGVTAKTYVWEQSATGAEGTWTTVATTANYVPSTATAGTISYRRSVTSGSCTLTSDPIAVTVSPAIEDNTIATANQNVCSGFDIALLDGATATAGSQQVVYLWEQSSTGAANSWTSAVGANGNTGEDFQPEAKTVTSPSTTFYRRKVSSGNCENFSNNVTVTVNPLPVATITQGQFTYFCTPGTALISATEVAGASYKWFRVEADGPVEVADTRTTNVGVVGTYYVVVKYDNTTCESTSATISVQETVVGNNIVGVDNGNQEVCYNAVPEEIVGSEATSSVGPVTYQWEVSADNITFTTLTGATGLNLSQAQLGAHTADRWYRRIARVGSCTNVSTQTVYISVRPELLLTSGSGTTVVDAICSGATFAYTPTSNAPANSTYSWSRAAVSGISNGAASGVGSISEELINTTSMPLEVTYVYKITTEAGCESALQNVNVRVNPSPVLNNTTTEVAVCSNAPFTYTATTATTSLPAPTFAWSRAAVAGIENVAASGTGATINETLVNTTNAPVEVTYLYTVTANECTGSEQSVVVTVNPRPVLSSTLTPLAVCSGATFSYAPTSATSGATFSWTRAVVTGISNAAVTTPVAGSVNETLVNTTTDPINVTYSYTTLANGCPGTPQSVVVTVNPRPVLSSTLTPPAVCSGATFSYAPTSATLGATYSWTRAAVNGISNAAVTTPLAGSVNETLVNTTTDPINVTYSYTTLANGCPGTPQSVVVTVNPRPVLSSTLTPAAVCSGSAFNYTATSATANTTFSWSRAAVTGISNAAVSNVAGNVINETLVNTTASSVNVVYVLSLTANGCTNTQNVPVSVSPNLPVSFTGTIANTSTFYSGQGAVALSATPTGGVFSSPTTGAVTLSGGVYSFNPCTAGAGTHTIRYTRTTGGCTSTVSKTVTVIRSTYRAVITANPHPFCRGGGGTEYTTAVYRDVQPGEIIYPYLVNANGEPVDRAGNLIPKGSESYPVPNDAYPFPANTPESIKAMSYRFFQPIVSSALTARQIAPGSFSYQWGKNDEQDRKNDDHITSDAGLSSQDYYEVEVTSESGILCSGVVLESNRMYSAVLGNYTVAITAAPNPICQGGPVTFTATLGAAFPWDVANLQLDFVLERGSLVLNPTSYTYTDAVENKITFTTDAAAAGGFVDGDKVFVRFSTNILPYLPSSNCIEGPTSTPVTIQVNDIALVQNPAPQNPVICLGGQTTFTAPVTTTGPATETYTWTVGTRTYTTNTASLNIPIVITSVAGSYPVSVVVSNSCETTSTLALGTLTVKPAITSFTVLGNDSFCAGSPRSFPITLSGSQLGVTYNLLRQSSNTPVQTLAGTGNSLVFTAPSRTGTTTYTVKAAYSSAPACEVSMTGSATITENTLPTVTVNSPTVCAGTPATVTAVPNGGSGTYTSYTWTVPSGVTDPGNVASFQTTVAGTYTVKVTDDRSCVSSAAATSTVTVKPVAPSTGTIVATPEVIEINKPVTFTANSNIIDAGDAESYKWYISTETSATTGEPVWVLQDGVTTNSFELASAPEVDFLVKVDIATVAGACYTQMPFTITTEKIKPLPVEIIYLNASKQGNDVVLEWATAMEEDNTGFEVQVSTDGFNYRLLTFVPAKNGNSSTRQEYVFTDKENGKSGTRYYRLKQIDTNGTFEFFGPKAVTFGSVASKVIAFPNPFHHEVTLDIASETDGEALITVTDAIGKQLLVRKVQVQKGFTTEKLRLDANLPRGLYIIKAQVGGVTQYIKMIKE